MNTEKIEKCCKCGEKVKPNGPIVAFYKELENEKPYEKGLLDISLTLEESETDGKILRYNSIIFRRKKRKKHIFHLKCKKCGHICEYEIEVDL